MIRCKTCIMPNTRPDTPFIDCECSACHTYKCRPEIDWDTRRADLIKLLEDHDMRCIVPSSGGKDSHAQVKLLQDLGADVTCVTATTCHLTPIGRANIDNLAKFATTIEVTPNRTVRRKLNKLGMELVSDVSWPEHVSIFTTPFNVAAAFGHTLMFYGENPQAEYGGPLGSEKARAMTRRWVTEFGGFLGLRPDDMVGANGVTAKDMAPYQMTKEAMLWTGEAHFLGAYVPWDNIQNARIANDMGMRQIIPTTANWWLSENLDNAHTGLHDHAMWRKYMYGRGCAQISVDVRAGRITRKSAMEWCREYDGLFPWIYAGVTLENVIKPLEISKEWLFQTLDKFTDHDLFSGEVDGRPIPKRWE